MQHGLKKLNKLRFIFCSILQLNKKYYYENSRMDIDRYWNCNDNH